MTYGKTPEPVVSVKIDLGCKAAYEYWEATAMPSTQRAVRSLDACITALLPSAISGLMGAPFLTPTSIKKRQLEQATALVRLAYESVPVYRDKYRAQALDIDTMTTWESFRKLPVITKEELRQAGLENCLDPKYEIGSLFTTRSSGSSGSTLDIKIDREAMALDTIHGVRQVYMQSGMRYLPDDETAFVYTVPWPTPSISGKYIGHFISSLIHPREISRILCDLKCEIISLYPSVLESILPFIELWRHCDQKLVIVHSEQSTKESRRRWSELCGTPVLDEYSSEEATRIALEFPCGHYHVCEDTVIVEILDPISMEPVEDGESGVVVVTNLMNRAMPFIRYVQGDLASVKMNSNCHVGWAELRTLEGRTNDAFLTRGKRIIPSGTLLDVSYRMMFDCGISVDEFLLVQVDYARVVFYIRRSTDQPRQIELVRSKLETLLGATMQQEVHVEAVVTEELPYSGTGKRRPIRRAFGTL